MQREIQKEMQKQEIKREIQRAIEERILLLDGALGTMIQTRALTESDFRGERFKDWDVELMGCNDILCLTSPEILMDIHKQYIEAGSDIICTNTFNTHPTSLSDYGLESYTYEIAKCATELARKAIESYGGDKRRYLAGSIGPTNRTASMSADVSNPAEREVTFDQLVEGYTTQVNGLVDGGAELIIVETIFDTLNAKAAIYAIDKISEERDVAIPIMLSCTIADASGRTLSGQTLEAFYTSVTHSENIISLGLNCAFGAKQMLPYLEQLSQISSLPISSYPNAGLPNVMGGYDETPEMFATDVEEYLRRGVINIIGGCCGTTPLHIECLRELVKGYEPRKVVRKEPTTILSGLEPLSITPQTNFVNIGERCNVAGSAKFARLIREANYEEAISVARAQVDAGAQIIDVCMDDGMIDAQEAMHHFLCLLASEPEIARLPTMIDSSKWDVLMAGLKVSQGKSIVNSISIKEGETEFLRKAKEIHKFGAAAVVMLFDEQGQADTYERKIEIAERAYRLLTEAGFPAEDIIFDANVLAVATGIEEHDSYAKAFIDATRWIKTNLPYAKVSGGVSNLSFAFRGNNYIREAMHSVFLYHAIEAGMDMAIVNAQMLQIYDNIEPRLLERIEDVILCRRGDAAERLIELAEQIKQSGTTAKNETTSSAADWRTLPLNERVEYAMMKGLTDHIEADAAEGYDNLQSPMRVIDELLMPAMERVGKLFGEGKMFLPQVVKSARVMKRAVAVLTPHIEALRGDGSARSSAAGKVLIATVKGDVHDIGKNIVSVVMACNGYEIRDLGVMVETNRIVDEAVEWGADVICMSGLITPSLEEMTRVVAECESRDLTIPVIIGGATTSPIHTAVKIAPHYSGAVIHAHNASDNPKILSQLLGEGREQYIADIEAQQARLRTEYERTVARRQIVPLAEAKAAAQRKASEEVDTPNHTGRLVFPDFDIEDVEALIDWNFFFPAWGLKGRYPEILQSESCGEEARKLFDDAEALLAKIKKDRLLTLQGVVALLPARGDGEDIVVKDKKGKEHSLPMLRRQQKITSGVRNDQNDKSVRNETSINYPSLADMVAPKGDHIALFALTAGVGLDKLTAEFKEAGDDYSAILSKLIADRLAEAFTERIHSFVRRQMWGYESGDELTAEEILAEKYRGIRVAFGYPATPDHSLKKAVFDILSVPMTTQMTLSEESYMISPAESLCGLMLSSGEYFTVGRISEEQTADYAQRLGVSVEEVERLIPFNA